MLPLWLAVSAAFAVQGADAVGHDGAFTGDAIEWRTRYDLGTPAIRVDFAVPLADDVVILGTVPPGATEVRDDSGQIVGLMLVHAAEVVELATRQPAKPGDEALTPPLLDSDCVQRVTLSNATFIPDAGLGIAKTLNDQRQLGIDDRAERAADRVLGKPPSHHPMYLVADGRVRDAGLIGTLETGATVSAGAWIGAGGIFLGVMAVLAASWKVIAKFVEAERVDAYIEREFAKKEP